MCENHFKYDKWRVLLEKVNYFKKMLQQYFHMELIIWTHFSLRVYIFVLLEYVDNTIVGSKPNRTKILQSTICDSCLPLHSSKVRKIPKSNLRSRYNFEEATTRRTYYNFRYFHCLLTTELGNRPAGHVILVVLIEINIYCYVMG